MSFDTRNNSALMKRAEQVRRWEESDTNLEPSMPKNEKGRKIKFSSGCVFLAACVAGDKDEVCRLLDAGADINTANVDGLTALHQACIDDNLEMVEFLVEHGADINRQDNEGWTPLHATSSCGFVSIARYLIENGADLTAINSDGELAIDLASTNAMADYLQSLIDEYGIDCEKARQQEEQLMLNDAKKWLRSDASEADKPHPKTGATALHVAAAKGYTKVLSLLLAGRANVDKQDNDGWTPLHAAAHWGQKEAAEMLVDALADMDIRNYAGQTAIDVADKKILKFLEELKANNKRAKRRPSSQIRISDTIENHIETPTKLIRVEVKSDTKDQTNEETAKPPSESVKPIPPDSGDEEAPWRRTSTVRNKNLTDSPPKTQVPDKEAKTSDSEVILRRTQSFENDEKKPVSPPVSPSAPTTIPNTAQVRRSFVPPVRDEESETQRKAHAKRVRETRRSTQGVTLDEIKSAEELVKKKNLNNNNNTSSNDTQNTPTSTTATANTSITPIMKITVNDRILPTIISTSDDIVNDTTQSHQPCEEITASYTIPAPVSSKLRETSGDDNSSSSSKISATYTITPPTATVIPSISIANRAEDSLEKVKEDVVTSISTTVNVPNLSYKTENLEELTKTASPTVVSGAFAHERNYPSSQKETESATVTESSTDPLRIREKRSLFDIDNANSLTLAEKLRNEANKYSESAKASNEIVITEDADKENISRKSDSAPSSPLHQNATERRPSWRLKFDSGSKFKLEDASSTANSPANNSTIITSAPAVIAAANLSSAAQKRNSSTNTTTQVSKPVSTTTSPSTEGTDNSTENLRDTTSEVTVTLRRNKTSEDKENDKENDGRNVQAAQAVIQRRRKPKRRSTGVVHLDMDEIDPEKQDSPGDNEEKESGNEKASRSRVGSITSLTDNEQNVDNKSSGKQAENGEIIDYKALWEAAKLENEQLKKELKKKDEELTNAKAAVERFTNATTKNSLSELEKRERRAMERKLSEMEEELKHLDILKAENQRLKEENGALIRVISKLSK